MRPETQFRVQLSGYRGQKLFSCTLIYSSRLEIPEAGYGSPSTQGGCARPKVTAHTGGIPVPSLCLQPHASSLLKVEHHAHP